MNTKLYLLHCETLVILKAKKNIKSSNLLYSIPPIYKDQTPILFEVRKDTSQKLIDYYIIDDDSHPNKLVKFLIPPLKNQEKITIHFDYFVLIKNRRYNDLPKYVNIKNIVYQSKEVKKCLISTKSVQSKNILIRFMALLLKGFSNNLIWIVKKIIFYVGFRRYFIQLFLLLLETNPILRPIFRRKSYYTGLMDALSCLFIGGLCCAQANLAVALLRANNIPTKILITTEFGNILFTKEKTWLDSQHYMFEILCPKYGWITCTPGRLGYQPKNYIISRIVDPKYENIAGNGLSYYGGMHPWFWISDDHLILEYPENIIKIFKKPRGNVSGVPAIRLWNEIKININENKANLVFSLTIETWQLHTKFKSINLDKKQKIIFNSAFDDQQKAIDYLIKSNIYKYIEYLKNAQQKYKKINFS